MGAEAEVRFEVKRTKSPRGSRPMTRYYGRRSDWGTGWVSIKRDEFFRLLDHGGATEVD